MSHASALEIDVAAGSTPVVGRDEMNLAEFPLTLLADRVPGDLKTLCYVSRPGTLIVTGSDAFGLPVAADADVIIGLIQLTRIHNNFSDPKVPFTRYQMLRILGWPDESKYYRRLDESLNRWVGVTLHYQNSWWDNRAKRYLSAKMHILESVILDEKPGRRGRGAQPVSSFTWNTTFIESCQADNLKRLDLDTYFSFRSAVTKRMYRFLDKRFYLRAEWVFDLKEFAFEYVGLSRGYEGNAGKIKEKLQPALEELETTRFLASMTRDERYEKSAGAWRIRLVQHPSRSGTPAPLAAALAVSTDEIKPIPTADPQMAALVARGVTEATAQQLIEQYPAERITAKLSVLDWLVARKDRRVEKSPAGYLVESIRKNYAAPRGYPAEGSRQNGTTKTPAPSQVETKSPSAEAKRKALIDRYWSELSEADRERLSRDAVEAASAYYRSRYQKLQKTDPEQAKKCLRAILEAYLEQLLGEDGSDPRADERFALVP